MSQNATATIAVIVIDIGKNSFHVVGHGSRGTIIMRQKWSRGQIEVRLANLPPCLIGMEACVGAHHLSRRLKAFGHDTRLMPAKYVRPYQHLLKGDIKQARVDLLAAAQMDPADPLIQDNLHMLRTWKTGDLAVLN